MCLLPSERHAGVLLLIHVVAGVLRRGNDRVWHYYRPTGSIFPTPVSLPVSQNGHFMGKSEPAGSLGLRTQPLGVEMKAEKEKKR